MDINPQSLVDGIQFNSNARRSDKKSTTEFMLFVINALWKAKIISLKERNSWNKRINKENN
jgi:hypothetical protein